MKKSVKIPRFSVAKGSFIGNNKMKHTFITLFHSRRSLISATASTFHYSIFPSFHSFTLPFPPKRDFGYRLNIPLFHHSILPPFHSLRSWISATASKIHYSILPLFHHSTIPPFHSTPIAHLLVNSWKSRGCSPSGYCRQHKARCNGTWCK